MACPSRDARVSKKQRRGEQSTLAKEPSSASTAPIGSGHTGSLTPSRSKPAPISPHFQAPRVRVSIAGADSRRQLLPHPPAFGSGVPRRQLLAAHQFPEDAQGIDKTLPMVPLERSIVPLRAFIEFQDNIYNMKGGSEDDSSFKDSDESGDSDDNDSDGGRDIEEISPSCIGKERVKHEEGKKVDEAFKVKLCEQVALATKKSKKGERDTKHNVWGFDNFFQLAFRDGDLWEHQEEIFKLWEEGKIKGQRVKLPTIAQRAKGGSEERLKPIPKEMKITPWRSLQGIREKPIILPILARVKGGALSLDEMSKEFEKFERRKLEDAQNIVSTPDICTFFLDDVTTLPVQYSVFEGKVENMESFVPPKLHYTLGIADAPYGFKAPHSINDDVKYGLSAYKKVIEAFKKVTNAESSVLVFFHAHDKVFAAKKAFADNCMIHQLCIWLSFATKFAIVGFFSPSRLSCRGTTTLSAIKKGQNVVAVEMDPLQVRFIHQRVTALKELPDEFQEVGMKNMATHPRVVDASGKPQPPFGPDEGMQFVDLEPYEEPNVVDT
ncbi:hypothetical protein L7F22_048967 [Adiantum nelumboides]|nr:hypothetical protein [Adiantum nelumboides]